MAGAQVKPERLQPWAWGPALLLVLCVALKDSQCVRLP